MPKGKIFINPLDKVNEGIKLCLANAFQYVEEAELLLQKGNGNHALGLLVLAAEEAGKAKMLLNKRDNAKKSKFIDYVNFESSEGFYNHETKLKQIALDIAMDEVIAYLKGSKQKPPASDYVMTLIDAGTRLREATFYVDFDKKSKDWVWLTKANIDAQKLSHLIKDVREAINYLRKRV